MVYSDGINLPCCIVGHESDADVVLSKQINGSFGVPNQMVFKPDYTVAIQENVINVCENSLEV